MSSWSARLESLDTAVLKAMSIPATFLPQAGGSIAITGIIANPALAEDYVPGLSGSVVVIRFFVRFVDITPNPQKGDQVSIAGASYDVFDVLADAAGGATLKLRKHS